MYRKKKGESVERDRLTEVNHCLPSTFNSVVYSFPPLPYYVCIQYINTLSPLVETESMKTDLYPNRDKYCVYRKQRKTKVNKIKRPRTNVNTSGIGPD